MSGDLPYKASIAKMIKEIETKKRPYVQKYSQKLNSLVDQMLTIEVSQRISVDQILQSLQDDYQGVHPIFESRQRELKYDPRQQEDAKNALAQEK